ncbi:MAG: hypothetical protein JW820_11410 [Spirochaetales bacterium]|nr:hypothetical protein [Spirochaetales bacterium]
MPATAAVADTVAPVILIDSPQGTGVYGPALAIRGKVSDAGAGGAPGSVSSLFYQVAGPAELLGNVQFDPEGRFSLEIPAGGLSGRQTVMLAAFDAAGNSGQRILVFEPKPIAARPEAPGVAAAVAPPAQAYSPAPPPAQVPPPTAALPEVPLPASTPGGNGPALTLQVPEGGAFYAARLILEGAVADSTEARESAVDITELRYELSGEPGLAGEVPFDVWGGFLLNLDTSQLTGTRVLRIAARDRHGRNAEHRLPVHDGRLPPRLSLRCPAGGSPYGARLLVSGRVEDPYLELRPGGGIDTLTLEVLSTEYRPDSEPTRLELTPGSSGEFEAVLSTGEWVGPQNLTVSAKAWNKAEADLSVRLVPGTSEIPSFAVASGDGQVMLSWEPVPLSSAYTLFHREGSGDPEAAGWRRVERVASPYNLRGLINGQLYSFRLLALSEEAPELSSGVLPGVPLAPETLQPTVTGDYQQIRLAWRQIPGASAYEVWRSDGQEGAFRRIDVSTESVYVDRNVRYGTEYSYRIRPEGVGSLSEAAVGRTGALPIRKLEVAAAISGPGLRGIAVHWDYAWVAAGAQGVKVYDIHDAESPLEVAAVPAHDAHSVAIQGELLYVADGQRGLKIFDVSEPLQPVLLGSRSTEQACDVVVRGSHAYLADGPKGLRVIDVSEPRRPVRLASFDCPAARAVAASGELVFVADGQEGLLVLDVSVPAQPSLLGSVATREARDVAVAGSLALVADGAWGLKIVDVADPVRPRLVGTYDTRDARAVAAGGRYAYLADGAGGLQVIDVSDPQRPVPFATEPFQEAAALSVQNDYVFLGHEQGLSVVHVLLEGRSFEVGSVDLENKAFGLWVAGELAFVAGHEAGVAVVDVADPASLRRIEPLGSWKPGYVEAVTAVSGFALAADRDRGLVVLDVPRAQSDMSPCEPLSILPLAGRPAAVATDGYHAHVAVTGVGLEIVDLADLRAPRLVGSFAAPSLRDVCVQGREAFVVGPGWGFGILDVSDPAAPVLIRRLESYRAHKVCAQGDRVYLVTDHAVVLLDCTNPEEPRELSVYETPYAEDLAVAGSYLCVAEGYRGMRVLDCGDPENPRVVSVCDSMYAVDVAVRGGYAFVVDSSSLKAVQILVPEWMR